MKYILILLISFTVVCSSSNSGGNSNGNTGGGSNPNPDDNGDSVTSEQCESGIDICCDIICTDGAVCVDDACYCEDEDGDTCPNSGDTFTSACNGATCEFACSGNNLDCNTDIADGCEVDSATDADNCGGCGNVCGPAGSCLVSSCDTYTGLSMGLQHTCALRSGGGMVCNGQNTFGELGNDSFTPTGTPTQPNLIAGTEISQVATGMQHTCALESSGNVWCWGENNEHQLGLNDPAANFDEPQSVTLVRPALTIAAGHDHTCTITRNIDDTANELWCWGDNDDGQMGDGNLGTDLALPTHITAMANPKAVAGGEDHTCAIASDDTVYCWGDNTDGQIGRPGSSNYTTPQQVVTDAGSTTALTNIVEITLGRWHSCARNSSNQIHCWGSNRFGQLGNNGAMGSGQKSEFAVTINSADSFVQVATFDLHTCAVDTSELVQCWGRGFGYVLGDISDTGSGNNDANSPVSVTGGLSGVGFVGVGSQHSCAFQTVTNSIFCWGSNSGGTLATGGLTGNQKTPIITLLVE